MLDLAKLQRQFQRYIIASDPAILAEVSAETQPMINIYKNAYCLRQYDGLKNDYEYLFQSLSEQQAKAIVQAYLGVDESISFVDFVYSLVNLAARSRAMLALDLQMQDMAKQTYPQALRLDDLQALYQADDKVDNCYLKLHDSVSLVKVVNDQYMIWSYNSEAYCQQLDLLDNSLWLLFQSPLTFGKLAELHNEISLLERLMVWVEQGRIAKEVLC